MVAVVVPGRRRSPAVWWLGLLGGAVLTTLVSVFAPLSLTEEFVLVTVALVALTAALLLFQRGFAVPVGAGGAPPSIRRRFLLLSMAAVFSPSRSRVPSWCGTLGLGWGNWVVYGALAVWQVGVIVWMGARSRAARQPPSGISPSTRRRQHLTEHPPTLGGDSEGPAPFGLRRAFVTDRGRSVVPTATKRSGSPGSAAPKFLRRGKVKEVYEVSKTELEFRFTNDISVFDKHIPSEIPHKGETLARTAAHWFELCGTLGIPHHFLSLSSPTSMRVKRVQVVPARRRSGRRRRTTSCRSSSSSGPSRRLHLGPDQGGEGPRRGAWLPGRESLSPTARGSRSRSSR